jgi:hypothetical protein
MASLQAPYLNAEGRIVMITVGAIDTNQLVDLLSSG